MKPRLPFLPIPELTRINYWRGICSRKTPNVEEGTSNSSDKNSMETSKKEDTM
jgi:hypothetical protein